MRLQRIQEEMGPRLTIVWKAFPLRPVPDPSASFKGTYREEAWKRCAAMAASDRVVFTMWSREDYPTWSLPALEAAKCVALQGEEAFRRVHLRLYEALFTRGKNIAIQEEVVEVVRESGVDMTRFLADYESGKAREWVLRDYEDAVTQHGVRAIPTVIVNGGQRLVGLVSGGEYRRTLGATSGG
ncbi:MAG: DsbA family protein [Candidatus Rokubacteria bacterium]|nr:DsbA family protein [Candidatus Rokubacteria bacterium]